MVRGRGKNPGRCAATFISGLAGPSGSLGLAFVRGAFEQGDGGESRYGEDSR